MQYAALFLKGSPGCRDNGLVPIFALLNQFFGESDILKLAQHLQRLFLVLRELLDGSAGETSLEVFERGPYLYILRCGILGILHTEVPVSITIPQPASH